jgi:beta-mannosidase
MPSAATGWTCRTSFSRARTRIAIAIRSPIRAAAEEQARQPFFVPYHTQNNPLENGNMLRKQQCDFGWDWNIALAPSGVYGPIRLEPANDLCIDAVHIAQSHRANAVDVKVSIDLAGDLPPDTPYAISLAGCGESGTVPTGSRAVEVSLTIDNPDLWWPAGLGAQTLHTLQIEIGALTDTRRIGLRDMRLLSEPDAVGRSFGLQGQRP